MKDWYSKSLYQQKLKNIGAVLQKKRTQSEISQTELAKQAGVRVETIRNWERSRSIPAVCYLPKLIKFLGCDPLENQSNP